MKFVFQCKMQVVTLADSVVRPLQAKSYSITVRVGRSVMVKMR